MTRLPPKMQERLDKWRASQKTPKENPVSIIRQEKELRKIEETDFRRRTRRTYE